MTTDEPRDPFAHVRILDPGALKALAHPIRVEIYDILSQLGPQTASSLAARLGESSGVTSYHLRALAKHDLIQEVEGRGTARERWWERPRGSVSFANPEAMKTPAGRAASQVVMSSYFDRRHRQLADYLAHAYDVEPEEWQEAAMLSTTTVRMTAPQLRELALKFSALLDEAATTYRDQTGPDVRPITVRADMFPLEPAEDAEGLHEGDPQ